MSETKSTIELDRLALLIGHKEIEMALMRDQINALLAQIAKLRKAENAEQ